MMLNLTRGHRLVIDFLRSGAFTSMIVVELSWLGTPPLPVRRIDRLQTAS